MTSIGWIGTGRMGTALVKRLIAAGYEVAVYNRTRAKAEAIEGAVVVDAIADLAGKDVVFTSVADSDDFAEVASALLAAGGAGVLVDCSTISPEVSARVREQAAPTGTKLLAAPVSGNPSAVAQGTASLVVSGPKDVFERVRDVLSVLGRSVTYVGQGESARVVKLCHNVFLGVIAQSMAEITVLAEKAGVSRSVFLGFINDSVLGSTFTRYKTPALVELDFRPAFTTALLRKDFDLGVAAARSLEVPVPLGAAVHQLLQAAIGAGHGEQDFASLLVEAARTAGLTLKPEES
jgi:3-hydroxyisobutyrate dehydrogenase-like beta-hydroxyacid dehydrogenase